MNDIFRYITAAILIFLVIALQPLYLDWLGYDVQTTQPIEADDSKIIEEINSQPKLSQEPISELNNINSNSKEVLTTIVTPLYTATLTSNSGGSFVNYILTSQKNGDFRYVGSYNQANELFYETEPVSLILNSDNNCNPCLAQFNNKNLDYYYFNKNFQLLNNLAENDTIFVYDEPFSLNYSLKNLDGEYLINKSIVFHSDKYINDHFYEINSDIIFLENSNNIEIFWDGGLRPTEEKEDEDVLNGYGIVHQVNETDDIQASAPDKNIQRDIFKGNTDWVAVRTKYFIAAIISNNTGQYGMLSSQNVNFGKRSHTPKYSASIGFSSNINQISSSIYIGPLDVDMLSQAETNLEASMDWGFGPITPISKGVLWLLKFMHNKLSLNYGLVLLLFAILVHLATRPLTKKSFESSQNMQKFQPQIKKIQAKYKSDPGRLNKETMALYKKHNINPLGGCLPILLQMPLLMALFVVFRSTIEFRGVPFMLWITDLSKPDFIFNLPFTIPIYGNGVAILPLIMGGTLLLTMRMSSATMDKSQKPVMYFMNGFFILLFNSFPSGLNLYYTAYNILSYFQQKQIRSKV